MAATVTSFSGQYARIPNVGFLPIFNGTFDKYGSTVDSDGLTVLSQIMPSVPVWNAAACPVVTEAATGIVYGELDINNTPHIEVDDTYSTFAFFKTTNRGNAVLTCIATTSGCAGITSYHVEDGTKGFLLYQESRGSYAMCWANIAGDTVVSAYFSNSTYGWLPLTGMKTTDSPVDPPSAPAYTYDKTAFLSGLAMGLCGKGNPTFEGSGKYLYNGVALPNIESVYTPEIKEEYPYAFIRVMSNGRILLCIFGAEAHYFEYLNPSTGERLMFGSPPSWDDGFVDDGIKVPMQQYECAEYSNYQWTLAYQSSDGYVDITPPQNTPLWSNFDIEYNGNVYREASEPIPVEDTFVKGYLVGAALRGKRVLPNSNE